MTDNEPVFFNREYAVNPEKYGKSKLQNQILRNAAQCSAAAPVFFPPKIIIEDISNSSSREHVMVDGGIIANNPSLFAYEYVQNILGHKKVRILSLGTGGAASEDVESFWKESTLSWYKQAGTLLTGPGMYSHDYFEQLLSAGQTVPDFEYVRADVVFEESISMSDVTKLDQLQDYGEVLWQQKGEEIIEFIKKVVDQKFGP